MVLAKLLFETGKRHFSAEALYEEVKQEKMKTEEDSYQFDIENTKVIWNGYKTNDKTKVVGYFNEFSCDREGQEFSSIEDLVNGLQFSIKSSSSS